MASLDRPTGLGHQAARDRLASAVYSAAEAAALYGVSEWAWYQSIRTGQCPAPVIRVGRRVVHPRAAVDRQLGLVGQPSGPEAS